MGVHTVAAQYRAAPDPVDRDARIVGQQAEFRAGMPGGHGRMGVGPDPGNHPHQTPLTAARLDDAFQPVDVVEIVDDHQTDPVAERELQLLVGLGIAVQQHSGRVRAGGQRGDHLSPACDVEVQALLGQ